MHNFCSSTCFSVSFALYKFFNISHKVRLFFILFSPHLTFKKRSLNKFFCVLTLIKVLYLIMDSHEFTKGYPELGLKTEYIFSITLTQHKIQIAIELSFILLFGCDLSISCNHKYLFGPFVYPHTGTFSFSWQSWIIIICENKNNDRYSYNMYWNPSNGWKLPLVTNLRIVKSSKIN